MWPSRWRRANPHENSRFPIPRACFHVSAGLDGLPFPGSRRARRAAPPAGGGVCPPRCPPGGVASRLVACLTRPVPERQGLCRAFRFLPKDKLPGGRVCRRVFLGECQITKPHGRARGVAGALSNLAAGGGVPPAPRPARLWCCPRGRARHNAITRITYDD